jgi:hypothetical protein
MKVVDVQEGSNGEAFGFLFLYKKIVRSYISWLKFQKYFYYLVQKYW